MCIPLSLTLSRLLQAGYLEALGMLLIGYAVVVLTVLSISAIATNGNVQGGGVYCILHATDVGVPCCHRYMYKYM